MICPLHHEDEDYRFGTARIEERIVVRICPKCGIVFFPRVEEDQSKKGENDLLFEKEHESLTKKQILKWP